ncbi:hypothetical protein DZJ_40350 [Dickeya ananatis]
MPLFNLKNNAIINKKEHTFRQKLFFFYSCVGLSLILLSTNTCASVEPLSVSGSKIYAGGKVRSFSGNSLFWSNTGWNAEKFYTAETVASLKKRLEIQHCSRSNGGAGIRWLSSGPDQ